MTQSLGEVGPGEVGPGEVGPGEVGLGEVGPAVEDEDLDDVLILEQQPVLLQLPIWEPTGDPEVDGALADMSALDAADLSEHAPVFDQVYRRLHGRLSGLSSSTP